MTQFDHVIKLIDNFTFGTFGTRYETFRNFYETFKVTSPKNPLISDHMKTAQKTLRKYKTYVVNMLQSTYTNGVIEGINNKIKIIKRIAFGYRSFRNFKNRVLITQGMLKLKAA